MQRRTAGVILICISAFLYGIRYLSAAIYGSNVTTWSSPLFDAMLEYVGNGPLVLSWIALIAGIGYLVLAELDIKKMKDNWNDFYSQHGNDKE